jgi:hypothetical protein
VPGTPKAEAGGGGESRQGAKDAKAGAELESASPTAQRSEFDGLA